MKLEHLPADKLFVDFAGKPLHYIDHLTGELMACQVFVACLPFSDYGFAMALPSQRIADFLYALGCCLNDIGGTPAVLVPDNFKSAIVKADRYEPEVNRALEDFANHYNITVMQDGALGGAHATNQIKTLGLLEVGKKADLIVLNTRQVHLTPAGRIISAWIHNGQPSDIESVMVDGEFIMRDHKILTVDEESIINEAGKMGQEIGSDIEKERPLEPPGRKNWR